MSGSDFRLLNVPQVKQSYANNGAYPGFVRFPERLIADVLPNVSANAWKILTVIVRDTIGWNRQEAAISYRRFTEESGVKGAATINKALADLETAGAITRVSGKKGGATNTLRLTDENFLPLQNLKTINIKDKSKKASNGAKKTEIQWRRGESENVPTEAGELDIARRRVARRYVRR